MYASRTIWRTDWNFLKPAFRNRAQQRLLKLNPVRRVADKDDHDLIWSTFLLSPSVHILSQHQSSPAEQSLKFWAACKSNLD